jgi:hypothetical protein
VVKFGEYMWNLVAENEGKTASLPKPFVLLMLLALLKVLSKLN